MDKKSAGRRLTPQEMKQQTIASSQPTSGTESGTQTYRHEWQCPNGLKLSCTTNCKNGFKVLGTEEVGNVNYVISAQCENDRMGCSGAEVNAFPDFKCEKDSGTDSGSGSGTIIGGSPADACAKKKEGDECSWRETDHVYTGKCVQTFTGTLECRKYYGLKKKKL